MLRNLHAVVGGGARFWAFVVLTAASAVIQAAAVLSSCPFSLDSSVPIRPPPAAGCSSSWRSSPWPGASTSSMPEWDCGWEFA